jgi:hypothetical protein
MNPVSWVDEKVQRSELERWHAYDWPDRWLRAEGLTRPEPGPASAVTAVADLMAGGRPGTVRGPTTHGAGGDGDWEIRVLDDGTGRVRMLLSAERTAGFRTVDPERIEADLRPSDADAAADLPERTRGALGYDFVATRIAPLP